MNTKEKLKNLLLSKNINHKIIILKEKTLKDAHIYCKINNISGQTSGSIIENYIKEKYFLTKNKTSLCIGDLKYKDVNLEIKISNGGKNNNRFNYVQIRLNHCCDYLLSAYYLEKANLEDLGELFLFKLNKKDLIELLLKFGCYAHGTVSKLGKITENDLKSKENTKEYALRPKYGDDCWKHLLKFRICKLNI